MAQVVRPFRGVSAADRLAERRADLLEAGLDETAQSGVAGLRMKSVCERAGLARRYFYEHFANRDELLIALFDDLIDRVVERMVPAVDAEPLNLYDRARAAMDAFLSVFVEDPRRVRLYVEAASMPQLAGRRADAVRRNAEFSAQQVFSVLGDADPRTRGHVYAVAQVVVIGQADVALAWLRGEIALSRHEYAELVAHVFVDALSGIYARLTR
ncbi:TetR/AcrR family transcriptional regulator [Mycobacterium sp. SM3041]|uniref:TetR/AcrR family transcriptional regulator n=1 Tax=Mycobacterium sp. SM3041 TaxID=3114291 RepID=UPI003204B142